MVVFRSVSLLTLMVGLAACDKGDNTTNLAALDAQLTDNVADPALKGALGDPIHQCPDGRGGYR